MVVISSELVEITVFFNQIGGDQTFYSTLNS